MDSKIQKILEACKHGMPKKVVDPQGNGAAVRALEKGRKVTKAKLEKMYNNVLAYEKDAATASYFKLKLNPDAELTTEQKRKVLKEAVANGISKSKIESSSHGVMDRLLSDGIMREATIDRLYNNLLAIFGYNIEIELESSKKKVKSAPERIRSLEEYTVSLLERVKHLEDEIKRLNNLVQKSTQTATRSAKRPRKILGLTVTQKSSKTHGKTYKRWYAIAKKDGKRKMIYIGNDLSQAKEKIQKGLERLGITS